MQALARLGFAPHLGELLPLVCVQAVEVDAFLASLPQRVQEGAGECQAGASRVSCRSAVGALAHARSRHWCFSRLRLWDAVCHLARGHRQMGVLASLGHGEWGGASAGSESDSGRVQVSGRGFESSSESSWALPRLSRVLF